MNLELNIYQGIWDNQDLIQASDRNNNILQYIRFVDFKRLTRLNGGSWNSKSDIKASCLKFAIKELFNLLVYRLLLTW